MSMYLMPIKLALIFFPLIGIILTLPFAVYQYRKYGYVNKLRVVVIFSFIFYILTAYYMVILPLPENRDVKSSQRDDVEYVNLQPFKFIEDISRKSGIDFRNPKDYGKLPGSFSFLQAFFNILLTLPFGVYMRYYFKLSFTRTILASFLLSLFFELTQLSGLYGIYNAPYRVFDVDDLILNTLGGGLGYLIAPVLTFFLPRADRLDEGVELESMRVGPFRRLVALFIDLFLVSLVLRFISDDFYLRILTYILYFVVLVYFTGGRSLGNILTRTRLVSRKNSLKFKQVLARNGVLILAVIEFNNLMAKLIPKNVGEENYYIVVGVFLFQFFYLVFLGIHYLWSLIKKEDFFYEKLSGTKIIIDKK